MKVNCIRGRNRMNDWLREDIIEYIRQRLGLEKDDESRDDEIYEMSDITKLEHVLAWNGMIGYAETVVDWIESIYLIELEEK